ncbi:MAG TPA: NUDIX domain-containing protein [Bryobacteraceae bacterium]|nr:NUDIX domain-containing protein [Bryobacteraceae bacterium]
MRVSGGILLYRRSSGRLEVLLAHPGGPFWRGKDLGAWSIPKGECRAGEDPVVAARREFEEETGLSLQGELSPLGEVRQAGGKIIRAWAVEGDCDAGRIHSNTFPLEWPPKSGKIQQFPEIDRFEWFSLENARLKLAKAQREFLDRLGDPNSAGGEPR